MEMLVILTVVAIFLHDIHFLVLFYALFILVVYLWMDNKFIKEVVTAYDIWLSLRTGGGL
ncbi:MAG: hypothetical protein QW203_07460 [Thermoplasmatales archaeon]